MDSTSKKDLICIVCPNGCRLSAAIPADGGSITVTGNKCRRGQTFAEAELTNPTRSLTTTVRTGCKELPWLPVRTDGEIPKRQIGAALKELQSVFIEKNVRCGEVILTDLAGTGINVIAASDFVSDL